MSVEAIAADGAVGRDALYKRVCWRIIPLLILCFIVAYYDRVNISFAKLQMRDELKFSNTVYGLGASLFFVGYIIFEIPSNVILHRVGASVWIARIMVSWGLASALMMFVTQPWHFYAMRFIVGAMEAGFLPSVVLYLTYWLPSRRRAQANSLFMTAISLSGITGGPLGGWILTRFAGVNGWSGWQWRYAISAAFPTDLTIAVAGLFLATTGILSIFPVFWTVPSTFLGGVAAAAGIAFINSVGNLGSIFSPTFIGWVNDQTKSTQLSVAVIAGMMVAAGLLIVLFWPKPVVRP